MRVRRICKSDTLAIRLCSQRHYTATKSAASILPAWSRQRFSSESYEGEGLSCSQMKLGRRREGGSSRRNQCGCCNLSALAGILRIASTDYSRRLFFHLMMLSCLWRSSVKFNRKPQKIMPKLGVTNMIGHLLLTRLEKVHFPVNVMKFSIIAVSSFNT